VRWLRWFVRAPDGHAKEVREEAEKKLAAAQHMTPIVERAARRVAKLPPDEFADRVAEAFRRRPA
jgi:DNA-binding transcriptional regulator YiaG